MRATSTLAAPTDTTELTLALPPSSGAWDVAVLDEQGAPLPLANEGVREDGWLEISMP